MAESLVVNGVTYPDVESVSMTNVSGEQVVFSLGGGGGSGEEIVASLISRTITEWVDENTTQIGAYALSCCPALRVVNCPNAVRVQVNGFFQSPNLQTVILQSATVIATSAFERCTNLSFIDLPSVTEIQARAFYQVQSYPATLIIRTPTVCKLNDVNAFDQSSWQWGMGGIYVPAALVNSYKAATNWTTYASSIYAIEDNPSITGG